jgi:hypothetical protein
VNESIQGAPSSGLFEVRVLENDVTSFPLIMNGTLMFTGSDEPLVGVPGAMPLLRMGVAGQTIRLAAYGCIPNFGSI